MTLGRPRKQRDRLDRRLMATITESEYQLITWYARRVEQVSVSDLLRAEAVDALVARARQAALEDTRSVPSGIRKAAASVAAEPMPA